MTNDALTRQSYSHANNNSRASFFLILFMHTESQLLSDHTIPATGCQGCCLNFCERHRLYFFPASGLFCKTSARKVIISQSSRAWRNRWWEVPDIFAKTARVFNGTIICFLISPHIMTISPIARRRRSRAVDLPPLTFICKLVVVNMTNVRGTKKGANSWKSTPCKHFVKEGTSCIVSLFFVTVQVIQFLEALHEQHHNIIESGVAWLYYRDVWTLRQALPDVKSRGEGYMCAVLFELIEHGIEIPLRAWSFLVQPVWRPR